MLPEFDRLAEYADLWEMSNDQTQTLRALRTIKCGEKLLDAQYLKKILNQDKRSRIEKHVNDFIFYDDQIKKTENQQEQITLKKVGVTVVEETLPFNYKNWNHFRQLIDSTLEVSLHESTPQKLPDRDFKQGSGYPTRRAMLLYSYNPLKFKAQNHAGILDQIQDLEREQTQLQYQEFKRQFKQIKYN